MNHSSPVLEALAARYERSHAGRTGLGTLDVQPRLEELLAEANCVEGDARELAERDLRLAVARGLIALEPVHRRDTAHCYKVRLSPAREQEFYAFIEKPSPSALRKQWSELLLATADSPVPSEFESSWRAFCQRRAKSALHWSNMGEFKRAELQAGRELLQIVAHLLAWRQPETFIRAASCRICADSKRLERQRPIIEKLLSDASGGRLCTLSDLQILNTPRHVLVAGPLLLKFPDWILQVGHLRDGTSISDADIERAIVETEAIRCVTIENKTSFHQRALSHPGDLHIHTSYPNAATLTLLRRLPQTLEFLHYGDADPAGFDILRELRESTKLPFRSVGMDLYPRFKSSQFSDEEIRLLERLSTDSSLLPEHSTLIALLAAGRKGDFEQEHRAL
jgi:hypothetical protein